MYLNGQKLNKQSIHLVTLIPSPLLTAVNTQRWGHLSLYLSLICTISQSLPCIQSFSISQYFIVTVLSLNL